MLAHFQTPLKRLSLTMLSMTAIALISPANAAPTTTKPVAKPATTTTKPAKKPTKTPTKTTTTTVTPATTTFIPATNVAEPPITTISYPKLNAVTFVGTDISTQPLARIATPSVTITQAQFIPTILVPKTTTNADNVDVSVVDDFLDYAMPLARHYPPIFPSKTARYNATQRVKVLTAWMENYAKDPHASYDILLRATKLNAIGRNLDLGSEYTVRASNYIARAIKLQDTGEANFLYGVMLAEGGGFVEGEKYLDKAAKLGYAEAYQSMAQSDLLNDKKDSALRRLTEFKTKYPNDPYIDRQLAIVNSGKYYIWDLPAQANP